MAGAGLKTFATGDVLTASDVNTYLMQQTITVFDTATARDAAITSPSEGMFAYTITTPAETLSYYDGSSWTATTLAADITSIVTAAASGLSGGATSGAVTLTLNLAGLTAAQAFGSDGSGVDVSFHSSTAGDLMLWDASEEKLVITGTNGQNSLEVADGNVTMADDLSVTGNVTIQGLDMDTIVEGDVIYGSGADTLARLAKGSNDEVLTLASGVPSWAAASAGVSWSGSTANGLGTFGSSSSIVAESTATYDGSTLALTTSGGGLQMDGLNSSDANTLDDYEEGTWTAAIAAASGTITVHGTNKVGSYVKIGQIVHIQGAIGVSAISSPSGALSITGLPFTPHNGLTGDADRAFPNVYIAEPTAQTLGVFGRIVDGAATIEFRAGTGETSEDSSIADVIDTSSQFYIGGSYRAAT